MPSRPIMNPLSKRTLIVCSAYVLTKTPRILRINLQMQDGASASEFLGQRLTSNSPYGENFWKVGGEHSANT